MSDTKIIHLGFIMDGNRRWAKAKNLPSLKGHYNGYKTANRIIRHAFKRGIKILTLFTFSTENWNRSAEEKKYLFNLIAKAVKEQINELHRQGVKIQFLGRLNELSINLQKLFTEAVALTKNNKNFVLNLAVNYGGQTEIIDAANKIIQDKLKKVTPEIFKKYLYSPDLPPLDLIIRTSGEMRTSGFLLWASAYSELYFTKKPWPAFTEKDLDLAIADFTKRQRRFGK